MVKNRRRHSAAFKFRIVLEALKGSTMTSQSPGACTHLEANFSL